MKPTDNKRLELVSRSQKVTTADNMSAQMPGVVTIRPVESQTVSHGDFQTAAGYRELAAQTAAHATTHRTQAERFAEQGQSELSRVSHQLAEEATRRSRGYAAIADFLEKVAVFLLSAALSVGESLWAWLKIS